MNRALATADDVNEAGNETSRLVGTIDHVVADWDWVTWLDRAAAAQRTIGEMTSQAEMTSSRARVMLHILSNFDALSQGSRSVHVETACQGLTCAQRQSCSTSGAVFVSDHRPTQLSLLSSAGWEMLGG